MAENVAPPAETQPEVPGKKKKKPKLSKAERKRLRVLAALELKQRLIREQLLREIELCKKSMKRGKPLWEGMCSDIKLKDLRIELQEWARKADKVMQKKEEKTEKLMKNIKETQELHERNLSRHLDQLDYLTKCHQSFRDTAIALYESQSAEMIEDYLLELERVTANTERNKSNNENIMHASNIVAKDRLRNNYEKYMKVKFREVCNQIELRYKMRDETAKKMRDLQDKLILWMKVLQGDMVDVHKTARFLYFMERQRNYVTESTRLNDIEKSSRKLITDLHNEILTIENDSQRKILGLKLEQSYFMNGRSIIKQSIERDKQLTHDKLLVVSSESYRVLNKLKEYVRYGELLLGVAACCRKHQTETEKVLPWSTEVQPDLILKLQAPVDSVGTFNLTFDMVKLLDISEEELSDQMNFVKNFWLRCSNVRLHNLLLMEEKRKLNEENERYRNIIRSLKKSDDVEYILESLEIKQLLIYGDCFNFIIRTKSHLCAARGGYTKV